MRTEDEELSQDLRAARLLSSLPQSSPVACQRVRARLARSGPAEGLAARDPGRPRALRLVTIGVMTGAIAAAGLFVARAVIEPVAPEPVAVAATLSAEAGWTIDTSLPNVALSYTGAGSIDGHSDAPRIKWDSGVLNVEVAADKGVRLAVTTREAEVRVVGTGFTVARDTLGTRVEVRHGRVEVDCGEDVTRALDAGDSAVCLPTSAAGLLGRARALQASDAPAADALDALDRGLAIVGPQPSVRDELTVRRVRALYDLARHGEALAAARTYLGNDGGGRRGDVELLAAGSAAALGGCAVAAPWLLEAGPSAVAACEGR